MGSRAPSIHQIGVSGVGMDGDKKQIESVDFSLSVDYSGGLGIAIDVALAYGKSAFLSAKGTHHHHYTIGISAVFPADVLPSSHLDGLYVSLLWQCLV